ncbi:TPA: ABC-three component system middle component 1 [Vibrio alginolyticus]|uniref:ABC-three component system middle component 1 n=1 Tax=unclassified Vibrio TaxID=2614977 RepID=UPI002963D1B5|nr:MULTISPECIES: ABC-three component system middle component 1 [unclassified Vibrio]EIE5866332.1 hypothetical protein [Vibrio alginolyticus]MDW1617023.1 ABC-three component system middle component 1 [Vibrio sp. Vb2881]MDW1621735.1 ABC-three component system middle component 1 [Vibrio sp. Vb2864]MDW1693871.1 ABC-three component system middle component 1 [Vibrio sp. Vb2853]MDW1712579.1 ABC-three component system middle component 1 [Vibrio sp. Vb2865]
MNKDFVNTITKLLGELGLSAGIFNLVDDDTITLQSQDFILVRNNKVGDYFLLAEIQISELNLVNRDLQISLMSYLNHLITDSGVSDLQPLDGVPFLALDSNFEKNTTLLLFTNKIADVTNLLTQITEIEENEYFFKKQVVLLPTKFLGDLGDKISSSTDFEITRYLQDCMNDTEKFKQFMIKTNEDTDYAGCAQFFEKLPFLHLNVESSESNSLQNMIDNEITTNKNNYSIKINADEEEESSKLTILDKNLEEIHVVAMKYASKMEESDADLDAEELLNNILGYGHYE